MTTKVIFIDGACSGNPGPMRIAIYSDDLGLRIVKDVGIGTNNRAEYLALIYALIYVRHLNDKIIIKSDSQLLVSQMNGDYKVKSASILLLFQKATSLLQKCQDRVRIIQIPREQNLADSLFH